MLFMLNHHVSYYCRDYSTSPLCIYARDEFFKHVIACRLGLKNMHSTSQHCVKSLPLPMLRSEYMELSVGGPSASHWVICNRSSWRCVLVLLSAFPVWRQMKEEQTCGPLSRVTLGSGCICLFWLTIFSVAPQKGEAETGCIQGVKSLQCCFLPISRLWRPNSPL